MNLIVNLLIAALAGCQAVEAWHHGSLFAGSREWVRSRKKTSRSLVARKVCELLACPFCLSHWTCFACVLVVCLTEWDSPWRLPVYALAVTRVSQLINDSTHDLTRSPSSVEEVEVDESAAVNAFEVLDDVSDNP